jgi:hypothetical protein
MKKPPETVTMRDYAITATNKHWATKSISSSTAPYPSLLNFYKDIEHELYRV